MLLIYNLLQLLLAPFILLVLPVYLISRPEKCKTIMPKLGCKLDPVEKKFSTTVWIHALSVGEVTSVLPLVQRLKHEQGENTAIVFSASTVSGYQLARRLLTPHCDHLIYAPLDILPVVRHFIRKINPDLFILVETDFWPNLLYSLEKCNIPSLLVNGRVSDSSIQNYRRFRFFFNSLFDLFEHLCMQTTTDRDKMVALGIDERKIKVLGNLKFAELRHDTSPRPDSSPFPEDRLVILAGSTHDGEERILLDIFQSVRLDDSTAIHLVIAPRNIDRADDIAALAAAHDFSINRFSRQSEATADVTIVDTIGDLSGLYQFADICFIGGSLVDEGGHNPLEAARNGKVVLFGPHMDDFSEISSGLIEAGGAIQVLSPTELLQALTMLVASEPERLERGRAGLSFVSRDLHIVENHMQIIRSYL